MATLYLLSRLSFFGRLDAPLAIVSVPRFGHLTGSRRRVQTCLLAAVEASRQIILGNSDTCEIYFEFQKRHYVNTNIIFTDSCLISRIVNSSLFFRLILLGLLQASVRSCFNSIVFKICILFQ